MDSSEKEAIPKEANTVLEEQEPEKQMEVKEMEENKDLVEEEKTEKESEETKEYIVKSKHFAGLTNVGATCYMNSLLQTLFMTPEFRQSVYRMSYLEGSKERAEQSIPIQMLLLFTRLQQSSECVSTRPLIKSFGWGDSEAFQQHDVQEFNRVLFDALKQSLEPEESQFISHLYEGVMMSYVKCLHCLGESKREESFLDLQLTVMNPFENIYNDSIEKGIDQYLIPEKLEGNNQYFCQTCMEKRDALKGWKFVKIPNILCLHMNRFTLDFQTLSRKKINHFVSFPLCLNLNHFIKKDYEGDIIETEELYKLIDRNPLLTEIEREKCAKGKEELKEFKNPVEEAEIVTESRAKMEATILEEGSEETFESYVPLANVKQSKSKLKEAEQQKKAADLQKKHRDMMRRLKGKGKGKQKGSIKKNDMNSAFFAGAKANVEGKTGGCAFEFGVLDNKTMNPNPHFIPGISDPQFIKNEKTLSTQISTIPEQPHKNEIEIGSSKIKKEIRIKKEEIMERVKENQFLYLKEGEYVFDLFAILIHSGGAYGGHYYAYIKDFVTDKWFIFNDVTVRPISISEIQRVFGEGKAHSTTAYMLQYRIKGLDFNKDPIYDSIIPEFARNMIKEQEQLTTSKYPTEFEERRKEMQVKVFFNKTTGVVSTNRMDTYKTLLEKTLKEFNLEEKIENCRIRSYHVFHHIMQDTYTGKDEHTLEDLRIYPYKSLALEIKKDEETFEEYNPNMMQVQIYLWKEGIISLDEGQIEPLRIQIAKDSTLRELKLVVQNHTEIAAENILIVKKTSIMSTSSGEVITLESNIERRLNSLKINEGINLYVEDKSIPYPKIDEFTYFKYSKNLAKWQIEFELEKNRFTLKFNDPRESVKGNIEDYYNHYVSIDRRQNIGFLKQLIAQDLKIDPGLVILKRGGTHGNELKDDHLSIKNSHFHNLASIFVQLGIPSKIGEQRLNFFLVDYSPIQDSDEKFFNFKFMLETPLPTNITVKAFKEGLAPRLNEAQTEITFNPNLMRLREKSSEKLTKVYIDEQLLDDFNMFEGKQIGIQILEEPETIIEDNILLVVRYWNPQTWELSPIQEIFSFKSLTLDAFSLSLSAIYNIPPERILVSKITSTWNFSRVQLPHEAWYKIKGNDGYLASTPFFLSTDGVFLVIKDSDLQPRELTEAEKDKYVAFDYEIGNPRTITGSKYNVPKEQALIINVNKKEVDKQEESQKDEKTKGEEIKMEE